MKRISLFIIKWDNFKGLLLRNWFEVLHFWNTFCALNQTCFSINSVIHVKFISSKDTYILSNSWKTSQNGKRIVIERKFFYLYNLLSNESWDNVTKILRHLSKFSSVKYVSNEYNNLWKFDITCCLIIEIK